MEFSIPKEVFDEVLEGDAEFYNGKSWEEYRSEVFKDILKIREVGGEDAKG